MIKQIRFRRIAALLNSDKHTNPARGVGLKTRCAALFLVLVMSSSCMTFTRDPEKVAKYQKVNWWDSFDNSSPAKW